MYGAANIRDLWKAYEVVKWEALVKEAKAMQFPMKLLKRALLGYATPRRVKLAGSLSGELRVTQSITAGCSCAKAFLMVLCYRAMVRVGAYSPNSVTLRVFVDDSGIQWKGQYMDWPGSYRKLWMHGKRVSMRWSCLMLWKGGPPRISPGFVDNT